MANSPRNITKIAREVEHFVHVSLKTNDLGPGEVDTLHYLRKHPGTQAVLIAQDLHYDKGALARQLKRLEDKGYVERKENPEDKRSQCLYATEKADQFKQSKAQLEVHYYRWLLEGLPEKEQVSFMATLEKLYAKSKTESQCGFEHVRRKQG